MRSLICLLLCCVTSAFAAHVSNITVMVNPKHPQFSIQLPSNPTTGYSWFMQKYDARYIRVVGHHFVATRHKKRVGAPGYEDWSFAVKQQAFTTSQSTVIEMIYTRPWNKRDFAKQLIVTVNA